jgi:sortase A
MTRGALSEPAPPGGAEPATTAVAELDTPPRRRRRNALRTLANVLVGAGAVLFIDAGITLLWQEPFSSFYAHQRQHKLGQRLDVLAAVRPTPVQTRALDKLPGRQRRIAFAARSFDRRTHDGDPLGRLRLPKIGVSAVVVEGTAPGDLRSAPGHYPGTPLPGEHGTVAVAGHRTTYGAWFRRIDHLRPGDRIEMTMAYGRFTYRVEKTQIVPPTALWVTRRVRYDRLILSACHPLYSAAQRVVVFSRLVSAQPRGAAA